MERSSELRDLVLGIYHDWSRGDASFVDRLFSLTDEAVEIGTDPDEFYVGGAEAAEIWRAQVRETTGTRIVPGQVWSFVEGSVGWVVDNPVFEWQGERIFVRITFIFHREGPAWKITHLHTSVGRSNAEVFGQEVTTSLDAVADAVEHERPSLEPLASPEGTLTIMFTDIESSTALNEQLGDDTFVPLLVKHHDIVASHTRAAGGSIVKSAGDGFMLVFPSARRAVEVAVAVQREVTAVDPRVRVRMGLHTGEPRRHAEDFFGRDVAYAARVGSSAGGGEILVSSLVKALVEPSQVVQFEPPRAMEFKGFAGVHEVFGVRWR